MIELLATLSEWVKPYQSQIAVAIVTTLLVIYGDVINKQIKRWLKPYHFMVRTVIFVLVCTFGYSMLVIALAPVVTEILKQIPWPYLPLGVLAMAIVLGYLADKRRYI